MFMLYPKEPQERLTPATTLACSGCRPQAILLHKVNFHDLNIT